MSDPVKIIECPRDAWQGLPKIIPPDVKAEYLRALVAAGFKHIDAVSFVSEKAVPQMADSEQTLALFDPQEDVEIIGIVVNEKGAERAIETGAVTTLGFPYSISATFLERNQRQTPEQSLDALEVIGELAFRSGLDLVVYISMAFGNPYGDVWSIEEVTEACRLLGDNGITQISLADTVGLASALQVAELLDEVLPEMNEAFTELEVGVHLHARQVDVSAKITAAYEAGCRRFDTAMTGLGGCPFAQDALVGNMATETAIAALKAAGAELPVFHGLGGLIAAANGISSRFGAPLQ
jgi:hydroxymethylglutaryl-CoA lyase